MKSRTGSPGAEEGDDRDRISAPDATLDTAGWVFPADLGYSLIIYASTGAQVVPLEAGTPAIVGRQPPANVIVADRSISRAHAQFDLLGEEVWVQDLGSTNGTQLNGARVEKARVTPRDEVTLGGVSVTLRLTPRVAEQDLGLQTHDRFQVLLKDEVTRALTFGRKASLLMLRPAKAGESRFMQWTAVVMTQIRAVDRLGLYGPDTIEVLLPERDLAMASQLAKQVMDRCQGLGVGLRCGVACYPDSAASAEELIEVSRVALHRAEKAKASEPESPPSRGSIPVGESDDAPMVRSRAMAEVFRTVQQLADSKIPVLIQGETGTGKEVVARAIHQASSRKDKPFRSINCGAIPGQLIESTLFGHQRGAFTGADRDAKGLFEEADEGTLLLDEIGDLALPSQAALLRVLETKHVQRVGSSKEIEIDVRILAATHRNLEDMCAQGTFRSDLYYRLNTMTLKLPPLRERREEIAPLALGFMRKANEDNGCHVKEISQEALALLTSYDWPGNVRELRNVIERAVVVAQGGLITPNEIAERVRANRAPPAPPTAIMSPKAKPEVSMADELSVEMAPTEPLDLKSQLQVFEATVIEDALARTNGNQSLAAELLGMPRRTLVHKLKTHEIERHPDAARRPKARGSTILLDPTGQPLDFRTQVERFEESLIQKAIDACGGNLTKAARRLGITERALQAKVKKPT
jgi:DNA-binding NtrC family response regulator